MPDFVGHLANCLINGDSFTVVNGQKVQNKIDVLLENKTVSIIQSPDFLLFKLNQAEYQGKFIRSTKIVIRDVEEQEIEFCNELVFQLASLLSFVTTSQVIYYGFEYPEGSIRRIWAAIGHTNIYYPVLETHRGDEIRNFIKSTWQNFTNSYESRKLSLIFDYIFQSFSINTIETKLVFTYVILESLKYTYAKEEKIEFRNGFFRKNKKQKYNFDELVRMMLSDANITVDMKQFLELRNDIIHSGFTEKSFEENHKVFLICQHIIREYLIKLLGYEGYYIKVR